MESFQLFTSGKLKRNTLVALNGQKISSKFAFLNVIFERSIDKDAMVQYVQC